MTKWISVTERLPPLNKLVEILKVDGTSATVYRKETSEPYRYVFKSGLFWRYLNITDEWRLVEEKEIR